MIDDSRDNSSWGRGSLYLDGSSWDFYSWGWSGIDNTSRVGDAILVNPDDNVGSLLGDEDGVDGTLVMLNLINFGVTTWRGA